MNTKDPFIKDFNKHLMSGVSYVLPFVIMYAFFITMSTLPGETGILFRELSRFSNILITPVFAAYIAYSISGKPALGPSFVITLLSATKGFPFLGGIIIGLLVGYLIKFSIFLSNKVKDGPIKEVIMSYIIVPIVSTSIIAFLMYFLLTPVLIIASDYMVDYLSSINILISILIASVLAAMISYDLGGPVNKIAYTIAIAFTIEGIYTLVAPILIAISIAPLSLGLATIFSKKRDEADLELGKESLIMGLLGLSEGAIPFLYKNKSLVLPSIMVGSVSAAILSVLLQVENTNILPSIFGLFMGSPSLIDALYYLLCHIAGIIITLIMLWLLQKKKSK